MEVSLVICISPPKGPLRGPGTTTWGTTMRLIFEKIQNENRFQKFGKKTAFFEQMVKNHEVKLEEWGPEGAPAQVRKLCIYKFLGRQ